jgi:phosphoribosylformylglycinamidine cyclo-ligase
MEMNYVDAGVNIHAGEEIARAIGKFARTTWKGEHLQNQGSFGGLFPLAHLELKEPVLISSMDGVGTKTLIADMMKRYDTIGEDIVNHCVNDILTLGAAPLFFQDYIGTGLLESETVLQIISGITRACRECGCALVGGEMAEMPSIYSRGTLDLVGSIVGIAEKTRLIDGRTIRRGDVLLGLVSNGLHTNGYSLVRKVIFEKLQLRVDDYIDEIENTIGEELLKIHRCYLEPVRMLRERIDIKGIAHITGGGIQGNLRRILPTDMKAVVNTAKWQIPPLFRWIEGQGVIARTEMFRVFNMGIGMVIAVGPGDASAALEVASTQGWDVIEIGTIEQGNGDVELV